MGIPPGKGLGIGRLQLVEALQRATYCVLRIKTEHTTRLSYANDTKVILTSTIFFVNKMVKREIRLSLQENQTKMLAYILSKTSLAAKNKAHYTGTFIPHYGK